MKINKRYYTTFFCPRSKVIYYTNKFLHFVIIIMIMIKIIIIIIILFFFTITIIIIIITVFHYIMIKWDVCVIIIYWFDALDFTTRKEVVFRRGRSCLFILSTDR